MQSGPRNAFADETETPLSLSLSVPVIQMMEEARRRSPAMHPKIQAREEGAGVAPRRRSPRLHPQIQAMEDGAGVANRRSPRLCPRIHASEEGGGITRRVRRRRGKSPVEPVSLPDGDDMLREIFLRLPPQPSSLPRASAVCKRWRGLITDPKFHPQFYAHHRKPPLLGVFTQIRDSEGIVFTPVLEPPDRITPRHFSLGRYSSRADCRLLDCRHGLLLVHDRVQEEVVVCSPVTGEQRRVSLPPEFRRDYVDGSVLCAAADDLGHVHGGCHSSPFKVVLMSFVRGLNVVSVYSSETGIWGNPISIGAPSELGHDYSPATLVGNALYWLCRRARYRVLEFNLDGQRLAVIKGPTVSIHFRHRSSSRQIVQAEDGTVGFAVLYYPHFQLWQRNVNGHGAWVLWKTMQMHNTLGLSVQIRGEKWLLGYDEDNGVIFLYVSPNVYAVQLKSMHSKKLYRTNSTSHIYPFTSFYTPGASINGGSNGAEMLHNP